MTDYATTGEAARALGISDQTLRRWYREGLVWSAWQMRGGRGDLRWNLDELRREVGANGLADEPTAAPEPPDRPQKPAVIAAVVTSRLGVLAGRRNDGKPPWTFIAGESEPGESPADTIIREVKEETGLLIKPGRTIGQRVHPKTGRHMVYIAASPATRNRDVFVGDEDELAEVRWLTLTEADELLPGMFPPVREHLGRVLRGPGR
jgi:8-oxo-dGTP pyrophosphatase MutT (NUDIX family)